MIMTVANTVNLPYGMVRAIVPLVGDFHMSFPSVFLWVAPDPCLILEQSFTMKVIKRNSGKTM
jgi:hypothetical protein